MSLPDPARGGGAVPVRGRRMKAMLLAAVPLLLGYACILIPTLVSLSRQSWSNEAGAHGPIVLATGLWLLWRQLPSGGLPVRGGNAYVDGALLLASLVIYTFGRAYDFLALEALGAYIAGIALLYRTVGPIFLTKNWFPVLYLGFMIPLPGFVTNAITGPLKMFASYVTTEGLSAFGIPVVRHGVTMFVAQYQLLVEDACSGINSLIGLTAISLFYVYMLHNATWRYALLLTMFVIPIAIVANIIRIVILVLLTYYGGDALAQGFMHSAASVTLFITALMLVYAADVLLTRVMRKRAL